MKTTQGKAVAAFTTLAMMARRTMPTLAAYKLFKLKKALADIVDFQSEQEMKLIEELGGSISDSGQLQLDTKEKRKEYAERHKELEAMECEVPTEKICMWMKELPELSLADMEALDEFVIWKE